MSDEVTYHPDLDESATKLWAPSATLRGRLLLGAAAALAFGGLGASAALTERSQGQAPGVTPALVLELASVLPLLGVLWSYLGIARDVESFTLRKSSWCALGVIIPWNLLSIRSASLLPGWGNVVILITIAAGLVGLLLVAFSPGKPPASGSQGTADSLKGSKAGWGGAGLALLCLLKFGSHFLLKLRFKQETWENLILLFLVLCTIGFFLRFAICKIRLRAKLGAIATMFGVAEILGMIAGGILAAYVFVAFQEAPQRPDFDDKMMEDLDAYWTNIRLAVEAGVYLAWSSLSALFFVILWNRQDPEADWLRDLREAENAY